MLASARLLGNGGKVHTAVGVVRVQLSELQRGVGVGVRISAHRKKRTRSAATTAGQTSLRSDPALSQLLTILSRVEGSCLFLFFHFPLCGQEWREEGEERLCG